MISTLMQRLARWARAALNTTDQNADFHGLDAMRLEDRVLYSVTPLPADAVDAQTATGMDSGSDMSLDGGICTGLVLPTAEPSPSDATTDTQAVTQTNPYADDGTLAVCALPDDSDICALPPPGEADSDSGAASVIEHRHEIVFIDKSIHDVEQLVNSLLADGTRDLDIVYIDNTRDGFSQVDDALSGDEVYDAIHFVSHGESGMVWLGESRFDIGALEQRFEQIQAWTDSLTADADLLFYGCNVVADADGEAFAAALHDLTGADIAASTDSTGSSILGGDWDLEAHFGIVETSSAFDQTQVAEWESLLAGNPGDGVIIWKTSGDTSPNVADWNGTSFGSSTNTAAVGTWRVIDGAEATTRSERIVLGVNSSGVISGEMWNGSSWSALSFNNLATAGVGDRHSFDVAYETLSGDALVVWDNGGTGTTGLTYRVWNGSSWSAAQTITAPIAGEPQQLYLAANPTNDEMILLVCNSTSDDYALVWNGSSWGNAITLSSAATSGDNLDSHVAYEAQSGTALVVYDDIAGGIDLNYRTWNGSTWSTEATVTAPAGAAGDPTAITLATDPTSDRIALGVVTSSSEAWFAVWTGSAWGSQQLASTTAVSSTELVVAVAFESQSGDLLAAYSEASSQVRYRTWTSGGGWSAELSGPDVGSGASQTPNTLTLTGSPYSNEIMLSVQDSGNDLNLVRWSGSAWGSVNVVEFNTAETTTTPFLFMYDDVNAAPTIGNLGGDALAYSEDSGAVVIDQGTSATVTDSDSINFNTGALTVAFIAGSDSAEDVLAIRNQGTGAGQIGVSGSNVTYGGVTIGTFTGGSSGTNLVITLNSSANTTSTQALIRNITYQNTDNSAPTTGARTVRFVLTDGDGGTSANYNTTVTVSAVNDAPVVSSNGGGATANITVAENQTAVTTVTSTDVDGGTAVYSISGGVDAARFSINSSTGVLTLVAAPNFESPVDSGGNNVYDVIVQVSDGAGGTDTQTIAVTISDVDEFNVGTITDTNAATNAVNENAANGTSVGITASASDADGTTNAITYSLDSNAGGRFTINSSTGVVTVANSSLLDREVASSYSITVRATSADTSFSTQAFTINLNDVDEFDVGTVSDSNAASNSISENAANGTAVGITAAASDADITTNAITYSLDDNAGGRFAVNSSTGVVTVANGSLLDREAAASHNITIRATSADGSFSTQVFTISLTDVDEFDVGSISDSNAAANSVAENASVGTAVGITASASDADATNNTISYSLDDNAGGRFAVNSSTGVVTVANSALLDREAAASHNITIRATSADGSFSTQVFTINLTDVDEFNVGTISDTNAAANSVAENSANGTSVGITASASDSDATTSAITYSLDDNAGGRFAVNSSTGAVTVADGTLLNREAAASHNITIRATSADGSFSTQVFTINLSDVDEFDTGAVTDTNAATNTIAENASLGTAVGITASASDADATTSTITYSLDDSAGGKFAINSTTGIVTLAGALDYETSTSHSITVRATSADGSFSTQIFTIDVTDGNESGVGPITDSDAAANSVAENSGLGTVVGLTALADDPDGTDSVTYSLDDDAGGRFAIDASTGVVTVAGAIDREAAASYNITIRATSTDTSVNTLTLAINVSDIDEFDVGAVSDANGTANIVDENAANGTVVGITAAASDADATTNAITYSLDDNAGGRFAINGSSGVVTVADGSLLDREAAASHNITIRATSADGSFSTQVFTINLADVDEFDIGAVTDVNAAANTVAENASVGTAVGVTAFANDADNSNNAITYSLDSNAGGRFAIDSSTGVVTVAAGLDYESYTSHGIIIRATSADGSFSTQSFTINVSDIDEFDVGPVTDSDAAANAVDENAANGTAVGITAAANDNDGTTNTIAFTLDDNAGGRFAINAVSGVVTVANGTVLDYETATSHSITVRATSADGSFSTQVFTINVNSLNDNSPVITSNGGGATAGISIAENALSVTTVTATDPDLPAQTLSYSIVGGADAAQFVIDANTGALSFVGTQDFENPADFGNDNIYDVIVEVSDGAGATDTQSISVTVTDADEFDVGAVGDVNAAANIILENAANGSVVGLTAHATDSDGTANSVTYSLDDNAGGRFAINSATGVVTVADGSLLDREAAASHNVTIRATSADGSFSTQSFTIDLADVDEFDTNAISDANAALDAVNENAANGSVVGITAQATDADATNSTIVYSLDDNAGGRFAIDSATGVVTVANGSLLNREAAAAHNVTIRATSADGSFSIQTFTIDVNDVNEFDANPITDTDPTSNAVNENAASGTLVGIVALSGDGDATTNEITYSLDDSAGGRFSIDSVTGAVTVSDGTLLDREAAPSHDITVRATSADGSYSIQTFTINLNDIDEFDTDPIADTDATSNAVNENAANGTAVGIVAQASDADATNNSIAYTLDDNAGGRFAIDSTTGVVTVANGSLLNREAAASHNVTVRATSADGSFSTQSFTINLNDVDEFDASSITDSDGAANAVNENATNGTVVGVTALASDADATGNGITYSLDDNAAGRFAIDGTTGVVTVADGTLLNREAAASHNIIIRATSADGSSSTQSFTINLNDVDEFDATPINDVNGAANAVNENAANGTVVGITAQASDADATLNGITYSLDDDAAGRFAIDSATGVVTVADGTLLDREAAASHDIIVRATSADGSSSTQSFTITLNDVGEFPIGPVSDTNAASNAVNENAANGTVVGITALASDPDTTNNTVTYTLDDDAGGRFAIDGTTGVVTVANGTLLDREAAASHGITIRATSADGSFSTQSFTINLNDVDEFDVSPVNDADASANAINENAAYGSTVGITAQASDADATTNGITYTLDDNAGGRFAIDGTTGIVTVADGTLLDREAAASHNITVRATSADGSSSTQTFTINLNDVDEFDTGAVSDTNAAANVVNENAANGTVVGVTAFATDPDAATSSIVYTLDDDAGGRFAIDGTTGVVTVADGTLLNREAAASHGITIRATSADGSFSTQSFTINVADVDEFDVGSISDANATSNAVAENAANGSAVGITAQASDADATTNGISYSLDDTAGGRFAIDAVTGLVSVADSSLLDYEAASNHTITVRATSADGSFSTQIFTINVTDLNDNDPVITSNGGGATASLSLAENSLSVTAVTATDADQPSQNLTYSISGGADAARFTIDANTGALTFVAQPNFEAPADVGADNVYDVTIEVNDGAGRTDSQALAVTITGVNESPVAQSESYSVGNTDTLVQGGSGVLANDVDEDGDALSAILVTGPQHGTLTLNADGTFTYTPNATFTGADSFVYQSTDGTLTSAPITVQLTITNNGGPLPPDDTHDDTDDQPNGSGDDSSDSESDGDQSVADDLMPNGDALDNPLRPTGQTMVRERRGDDSAGEVAVQQDAPPRTAAAESAQVNDVQSSLQNTLKGARRVATTAERIAAQALGDVLDADAQQLSLALVNLRNEVETAAQLGTYLAGSVAFASAASSAGYAIWALRSAHFVTSFLATVPAWRRFDPLPLLNSPIKRRDEGESLAEIALRSASASNTAPAERSA